MRRSPVGRLNAWARFSSPPRSSHPDRVVTDIPGARFEEHAHHSERSLALQTARQERLSLQVNLSADVIKISHRRARGWPTRPCCRLTAVYLVSSAQYQFFNCGVLLYACMSRSTCTESTLGLRRVTWLRKRRRQRRRRPPRRKRSEQGTSRWDKSRRAPGYAAAVRNCRGLMCFSNARFKSDRDARSVDRSGFCFDE